MRRVFIALAVLAFATQGFAAAVVRSGAGTVAATAARDQFRTDLGGGTTAGANGSFGGVRREINWDGVPDASAAPNNLPANFFNVNSPRGVVFSTPGTGFQVSANAGVAPIEFDNINNTYSSNFVAFSPQRLFSPLGSNITDVTFFVAGTTTPATVTGFGSIFTDVDNTNVTSMQFFDSSNNSMGTFFVPVSSSNLSFLGVFFNAGERVKRVRIITGSTALGPNETILVARSTSPFGSSAAGAKQGTGVTPTGAAVGNDVVVMDDFLFTEPVADLGVPTMSQLGLLLVALALVGAAMLRLRT